jgi:hypothetical protein
MQINGIQFIGEQGSRKPVIEALVNFLDKDSNNGEFQVLGAYGIGKSIVIQKVIETTKRRSVNVDDGISTVDILALVPDVGIKSMEPSNVIQKIREKENPLRIPAYNLNSFIKKLVVKLNAERIYVKIILIWLKQPHIAKQELYRVFNNAQNIYKIISENKGIDDKPYFNSTGVHSISESIFSFWQDEAHDLISINFKDKLGTHSDLINKVCNEIYRLSGPHPLLLQKMCEYIKDLINKAPRFQENLNDKKTDELGKLFEEIANEVLEMQVHKSEWIKIIKSLFQSISPEAEVAAKTRNSHADLKWNGLLLNDKDPGCTRPIKLVRKFFEEERKEQMNIFKTLSEYAFEKTLDLGWGSLKRVWQEIFPPTPIYFAAIKQAAEAIRTKWAKDNVPTEKIPHLDLKNLLSDFKLQEYDYAKIKNLPPASREDVKKALFRHVMGGEEQESFVEEVLKLADARFISAISFDEKREASLWKEYILQISESRNDAQAGILQKMSEIENMFKVWLTLNTDRKVQTIEEVFGPTDTVENILASEGKMLLPLSAIDIERISVAEFWDAHSNAYHRWWDNRLKCSLILPSLRALDLSSAGPGGLTTEQQNDYERVKKDYKEKVAAMAQAKADYLALEKRAKELFRPHQ